VNILDIFLGNKYKKVLKKLAIIEDKIDTLLLNKEVDENHRAYMDLESQNTIKDIQNKFK